MPTLHKPARSLFCLGIVGTASNFFAVEASAAVDQYQLDPAPSQSAAENADITFAEVIFDGQLKPRAVQVRMGADGLEILKSDLVYLGLDTKKTDEKFVALKSIARITFSFNALFGRLEITRYRKGDGPNSINLLNARRSGHDGTSLTALIIDYDMAARVDKFGTSLSGLAGARVTRGDFAIASDWQINSRTVKGQNKAVRLHSSVSLVDQDRRLQGTLGDFVAQTSSTNRSVRLGGIQISSDFSTRPDLITYPLPEFQGQVAVPSALDVIVNDRRISGEAIEAGDFAIRNVPVSTGRNSVSVIVKNASGQEQVQSVQFYSSRNLLETGLSESSVDLGFIRRNFGTKSNEYGQLALVASHRRGISKKITLDGSIEASRNYFNVGIGTTFTLGNLGLMTASAHGSALRDRHPGPSSGAQLALGFETTGSPVSLTFQATQSTRKYADLAAASGDRPPTSRLSAGASFDLKDYGRLQLLGISQRRPDYWRANVNTARERSDFVSASYRTTIRKSVNLFVDLSLDPRRKGSTSLLAGVSMLFGARTIAQASANQQNGGRDFQVGLSRPDTAPGEIGYEVSGGTGYFDRAYGGLSYRGQWGRVAGRAEMVNGDAAASLNAQGSLVLADSNVYAANRISGGFAVIRTGSVSGVDILRDNRVVARTGKSGSVLITDLPSYVPVRISVNPATVAESAVITRGSANIRATAGGGTLIDLPIEKVISATVQLLGSDDLPLPAGSVVEALPSRRKLVIGFDGMLELNTLSSDTELVIAVGQGKTCFAKFPKHKEVKPFSHLGILKCDGYVRTLDLASMR